MKEKISAAESRTNCCSYNPMIDSVYCTYADIDANGIVSLNALCSEKFSRGLITIKKKLPFSNIYVDKNYFDVLVADPVSRAHYYLYNVYYIEDGGIYVIGIASRLSFDSPQFRPIKNFMSTHLIFKWHFDAAVNEFVYETNSFYSIKFNPNYFSQINSLENLEKISQSEKIYSQLSDCVTPYDRPMNYIQRAFFMAGADSVKKYDLNYGSYKTLTDFFNSSAIRQAAGCYFSFEQFYLNGMMAAINFYKK
ncbi:MAG TPA: hypothetical protein PKL57_12935 [Candidatus Wallbacteria bacterium]|nr:hypothetical protein [Candidatus Wallbacteria bacterium]